MLLHPRGFTVLGYCAVLYIQAVAVPRTRSLPYSAIEVSVWHSEHFHRAAS
jgi:hypothetical protein